MAKIKGFIYERETDPVIRQGLINDQEADMFFDECERIQRKFESGESINLIEYCFVKENISFFNHKLDFINFCDVCNTFNHLEDVDGLHICLKCLGK